ncbi:MAG: isoprenylcysteine carboxylmethyltransferase family protein [Alphaproteobacteria bacterium]|nr:isoprenylcysteine carboxylmethyltransferase family protein [Alphaproteobacteria bacterium]
MNLPTLKAVIILPGTALVYVPAAIVWFTRDTTQAASFPPASAIPWLTGVGFAAAGLILMAWTVRLFVSKGGGGTPAPWQPIKNFIVQGPYRYVRNPMLIGVNLFLTAEAILLQSYPILAWMVVFVVVNTIYFRFSEEPQLKKRFGRAYADYKREVPRWLPRLTPYRAKD